MSRHASTSLAGAPRDKDFFRSLHSLAKVCWWFPPPSWTLSLKKGGSTCAARLAVARPAPQSAGSAPRTHACSPPRNTRRQASPVAGTPRCQHWVSSHYLMRHKQPRPWQDGHQPHRPVHALRGSARHRLRRCWRRRYSLPRRSPASHRGRSIRRAGRGAPSVNPHRTP